MARNRESETILNGLRERFLDGEKMSVKEIVEDYFNPASPYAYLVAAKKVRGYLSNIKHTFRNKEGIWFGCLDNEGTYGIATSAEEVRYAVISYYKFVKGNMMGARLLVANARQNGILPAGMTEERMLVAKLEEEKKDD